jgi:hypothetical protein
MLSNTQQQTSGPGDLLNGAKDVFQGVSQAFGDAKNEYFEDS